MPTVFSPNLAFRTSANTSRTVLPLARWSLSSELGVEMEISKVFDARDSIDEWDGQDPIQINLNPSKDTIERLFQWSDECQSLVQSLKKGWREGVQIKCSGEYNLLYDRLLRITSKQEITNSKGGRQPDKMFRQAERTMQYDSERFQRFDTIQDPRPAIQ